LNVRRIINEPTAAALAFGLDKKKSQKVIVYDLGGGTFDVSVLEIDDGLVEVFATNGDTHLGGDDFDQVLINYVADDFQKANKIDLRKDQMALQRLREASETAKKELSSALQTTINLPFITADATGPKHLQMNITRATFDQLTKHLVERTRKPCEMAMKDAKLTPKDIEEVVLVGGSTRIPAVQAMCREIFGKEPNRSVNPDEVVAVGAAVQGGILNQEFKEMILLDVTPLSLGIETLGGVMTKLIERNTTIPTERKEVFSTADDNQPAVDIHVLQGERTYAKDNHTLGKFQLTGIPPARRGVPKIEVKFSIDANGILNVSAKDLGTGKEQSIKIQSSSGLSKEDIERMRKDAEEHATEDIKRRETIESKNKADSTIYETEKMLKENGDKLAGDIKSKIQNQIEVLKKAKAGEDKEAIDRELENLMKVGQELYSSAQSQEGGPSEKESPSSKGSTSGKPNDDVIDADFEVKN
ncbi:MAG: molecular chaperone DnaK, partial [Planctomycetota bacterium]